MAAEGVELTIESADGSFTQPAETDADGHFEVPVPGPGNYSVTIDDSTLPDEVVLRNADRATLDVAIRAGQVRNVLFPLDFGEAQTRDVSSTADRAARLTVQGIRFGLIIAMCAVGLSLIFGTTGLTNFAHGEMVTFGALIAFLFNVTIGWHLFIAAPHRHRRVRDRPDRRSTASSGGRCATAAPASSPCWSSASAWAS